MSLLRLVAEGIKHMCFFIALLAMLLVAAVLPEDDSRR